MKQSCNLGHTIESNDRITEGLGKIAECPSAEATNIAQALQKFESIVQGLKKLKQYDERDDLQPELDYI